MELAMMIAAAVALAVGGTAIGAGAFGLKETFFPAGRTLRRGSLPGERSYSALVGDAFDTSIVGACINWMARNFPEAKPAMWREDAAGGRTRVRKNGMLRLLHRPNPFYSWRTLVMAMVISWVVAGNIYLLKRRSTFLEPIQLWWVPQWMMKPAGRPEARQGDEDWITHYDYWTPSGHLTVARTEVVHVRFGLDPDDPRVGISPIHAELRNIFTDEEAARFTASLLKNMGVPGVTIAPEIAAEGMSEPDAEEIKKKYMAKFGGDQRGEPMVFTGPMKVTPVGFSPKDLDLSALRDVAEERVTSALGLSAAVVGFGTGLHQVKVGATMDSLRDAAHLECSRPTLGTWASEIEHQLLPDFVGRGLDSTRFEFDFTGIPILADHELKRSKRIIEEMRGSARTRAEARKDLDLPIGPRDNVYLVPSGFTEVPANEAPSAPATEPESDEPEEGAAAA